MNPKDTRKISKLANLKKWLTIAEAAKRLSITLEEEVNESEILRLSLDGHLKLSLFLPQLADAKPASALPINNERERAAIPKSMIFPAPMDNFYLRVMKEMDIQKVHGLFDLPLVFGERELVGTRFSEQNGGKHIVLSGENPIIIKQDDELFCLQALTTRSVHQPGLRLPMKFKELANATRIPDHGIFVIRTEELQRFEGSVKPTSPDTESPPDKTERDKLLVTAALCNSSKIDYPGSGATNKNATETLEYPDCTDDLLQPANHENTPLQHPESMQPAPRDPKNNFARMATLARQKKTKDQREEVKAFYRDHIYPGNPNISNEQAGAWLKDTFTKISVRKLSEYAKEAKNEIRSRPPVDKT